MDKQIEEKIENIVIQAFVMMGYTSDKDMASARGLSVFLSMENLTTEQINDALMKHMRESSFPPKPADILKHANAVDPEEEADFMRRFAGQAMNPYPSMYGIDNDVYTVRTYLGGLINLQTTEYEYQKAIPSILAEYKKIKSGQKAMLETPENRIRRELAEAKKEIAEIENKKQLGGKK